MRNPGIMLLLALLLLCGVLLIAIGLSPSISNAVGMAHPTISPMRAGGDGAARMAAVGIYGFLFQTLALCCCCVFYALGVSKQKRDRKLFFTLGAILAFSVFVWFKVYQGHVAFLATKTTGYFLAFPTATAWMLYGVGFCGVLLIAFYSIGFKQYVYNEADAKAFADLVKKHQSEQKTQ